MTICGIHFGERVVAEAAKHVNVPSGPPGCHRKVP